jgi:hypothetical protein
MGNEQSAPMPRRPPNKLSKPRTNNNSTSNLLSTKTSNPTTRQNSFSTNNASPERTRYSVILVEEVAGEAGEKRKEETTQRKRMSLFRSKTSQDKPKLRLEVSVETHSAEPSPLDQPNPWWSRPPKERSTKRDFELAGDEPYYESPTET